MNFNFLIGGKITVYKIEAVSRMMINLNTLYKNSGIGVCDRHCWLAVTVTIYNVFVLCETLAQGASLHIGMTNGM